jgi:elongation factor G
VPRICFVNKLDRTGADFWRVVDSIRDRLGANPVPVQVPIGVEDQFRGVIDLINMRAITYGNDLGDQIDEGEIPAEYVDLANEWREKLVESLADLDDEIAAKYLEGEELSPDELRRGLRAGTLAYKLIPVLTGSALKNKGIQPMLDAVVTYLPSPLDIPAVTGIDPRSGDEVIRETDPDAPFAALAFKIAADPFVGKLAFFRVYSGTLKTGSYVYNSTKGGKERIGRILQMHANHREEIDSISAGNIAAAVGLKNTFTGDTLCDESKPIVLESISFPEPVIELAVEPKTKADQDKMAIALQRLAEEDPTFRVSTDAETAQTRIAGMGELHLEVIVDRMLREFKVQANVGRPQVSYREAIRKPSRAEGRFVRQTGGKGQYGHAILELEPLERGAGVEFESKIVGGAVPREFIKPIEQGLREALQGGVVAGYPVIDLKATLIDGSYHEVDSSEMAFKIAGSMAAKDGVAKAEPTILEPVMKVDVTTAEEFLGDVIGNLNARRGQMDGIEEIGNSRVIHAHVPLAEMFGYATELRSMTQGRATYSMEFSRYAEVPSTIAQELIAKSKS